LREKELRLALVCYGGVSLAVYMHGITKEVWKLCRASMRRHHKAPASLPPPDDSEAVYGELLDSLMPDLDLTVSTDIIAGASAGGINGILLAQAIATGQSMEPLRTLWLETADSDRLLDPVAASRPLSKLWALPLIWYTRRRSLGLDEMEEPAARAEASAKLSRLMRSRWFQPPFSGPGFSGLILDALDAMAASTATPPLVAPQQALDLFVTVTDYDGARVRLPLNSPLEVAETDHRLMLAFHSHGADIAGRRHLADIPDLVFAARATASFPGAFPPFRLPELDQTLAARGLAWPGRQAFLARQLSGYPDPARATLIDGSVINGRPFGPAIEALVHHRSHREVDRRFVYVDPRPGTHHAPPQADAGPPTPLPGFFSTILRSLSDIPRQQPINDSLGNIEALSARVRRLRAVTDGMAADVDAAIEDAVGRRFLLFGLSPEKLAELRARGQSAAATRAGFSYAAHAQLKLARLVESLAQLLSTLGAGPASPLRRAIRASLAAQGLDNPAQAVARDGATSPWVTFLRRFDLDFRIRRLRFLIRRINRFAVQLHDPQDRAALEAVKAGLYTLLEAHVLRRQPETLARDRLLARLAPESLAHIDEALDALAAALDLKALDDETDSKLAALFSLRMARPLRRQLLNAYLGFPFYDIATLALLTGDGSDEFDEIKVDRLSPDDARSLAHVGGTTLKGARLNAFGAFFSRAYREHDYLWGRLHAAERLIEIVASASDRPPADLDAIKTRAFLAILEAEAGELGLVPDLVAAIRAALTPESASSSASRPAGGEQ
jgi:patatin-related protein